jgi:hypothetical protein
VNKTLRSLSIRYFVHFRHATRYWKDCRTQYQPQNVRHGANVCNGYSHFGVDWGRGYGATTPTHLGLSAAGPLCPPSVVPSVISRGAPRNLRTPTIHDLVTERPRNEPQRLSAPPPPCIDCRRWLYGLRRTSYGRLLR